MEYVEITAHHLNMTDIMYSPLKVELHSNVTNARRW